MKRWGIRLTALTVVVALGWITVAWAQKHWQNDELAQGPDLSKPPVNGDAYEAAEAESRHMGLNTAPADPFQNSGNSMGDRYPNAPRQFDPDPNASALATRGSEIASDGWGYSGSDIPSAQEAGMNHAAAESNAARAGQPAPGGSDPFVSNPIRVQPAGYHADSPDHGGSTQYADDTAGHDQFANHAGERTAPPHVSQQDIPQSFGGNVAPYAGSGQRNQGNEPNQFDQAANHGDEAPSQNLGLLNAPGTQGNNADYGWDNGPSSPAIDSPQQNTLAAHGQPLPQSGAGSQGNLYADYGADTQNSGRTGENLYAHSSMPAAGAEGHGRPGEKELEGAQSPSVTIEKIAPAEVQVGKPAKFEIVIRNTGTVVAEGIEVVDAVPQGATLIGTTPQTQTGQRGEVVWNVGELKPNEESRLQIDLMPIAEGEIGSVAMVHFRSLASVRTIATKPELLLELESPKQVLIGNDVAVNIKVSNPGTGAAEKIVLHAAIPQGFQHPAGSELEFEVGDLKPGESRSLELTLHAAQAGPFKNTISVTGDANLSQQQVAAIEVIAPALQVAIDGPGLRFLERPAKYSVAVKNPGTAPAKDVELITRLPKGMQFVEASDMGHYDATTHSVMWSLAELPAGQDGSVMLTMLANEPGEQRLRGEGRAAGGLSHTAEQTTMVEGVAAVLFTVVDVDDPVEVGGQTTYEIRVVNQGSKAASRVMVVAELPAELRPISAEGPTQHRTDGQRVIFEPLARLAPKADITYQIVAKAVSPGDSRIKVLLQTDDMKEPVTKEESTRVYTD